MQTLPADEIFRTWERVCTVGKYLTPGTPVIDGITIPEDPRVLAETGRVNDVPMMIGILSEDVTLGQRLYHLALPAFTLSLMAFANIALHTRQKLVDVLSSEYVLFARARGEGKWTILRRHGLRNVLLPALTLQFASFAELFGGSVMAENVFSYPGLGSAVSAAGLNSDVPLLLGITLFSALFVSVGNLVANLLYGVVDPQIREAEE
jgi:peptide/nickel transport system permease protein